MMTRDGSVNDQWLLCSCFLSKNIRLPFEFIMIAGSFSSFIQKLWKFDYKIFENFSDLRFAANELKWIPRLMINSSKFHFSIEIITERSKFWVFFQ